MAYENTAVPTERSQAGIRQLLQKHGASSFTFGEAIMEGRVPGPHHHAERRHGV